ncbi:hypothetical protein CVS40_5888 [Lucilia cuprina]|nr:hypothetical protein CVS40_5888 [Lucilia cuprina]
MQRERFENYLTMKDVFANKTFCHQMLVNSIGSIHFKLSVSLIAPKTINDIFVNKQLLIISHLLHRDIIECEFRSTCNCNAHISNIFLRAQFTRGLKDRTIREQLLQSEEAEFEKIIQGALSLEMAVKLIQSSPSGFKDRTIRQQLLQSEEAEFEKFIQGALSLEVSWIDGREINTKQSICSDINKI